MQQLLLGQTLAFAADPFATPPEGAAIHDSRGGVLVENGRIAAFGHGPDLRRAHPRAAVTDHGEALILPGFVDAHMHYPQTGIVASWGKRLIDWLETYTFPEEARLADPAVARQTAALTLDLALDHGTTTLLSFCTIHEGSADAWFEAAEARGMRVAGGRTCMDRNAPASLRDTPQSAHDESARLIARWHGRGRATYAITPRFTPTSSPAQLEALGALWAAHPTCLMQTHLSEQTDEVEWVRRLHPEARDYLETYDRWGLVGPGAVFGHAIHLTPRERARLREAGAALAHCPTSNAFIGSGLMDLAGLRASGIPVGLATDTGGGSSFSMLRTMAAAYEIAQLGGHALHPAQLLWLATEGSAAALRLSGVVGRLAPGAEADLVVLDLASTPAIAQRAARAGTLWEAVFPTIMMGDDRAVRAVYVGGRRVRPA
ncbi:guanine deaminase [Rubellimicrobium sp. CFH 75288]|uniref:guanine deaminase n=1 Tax=Rubellimicrobium sp. CFH 75288 TaxID=2697034 RepID=UPI0014122879|nr:guanine deaminase [Rubellimicrobium sp. CFH 75288]NAZ38333.1 guanine deaminase [Rubellimicrobium sp. CFH 75288]